MLLQINASKIKAIKGRIYEAEEALEDGISKPERLVEGLIKDMKLLVSLIDRVREDVHFSQGPDDLLYIAEYLGTNCYHDKDVDDV